ncbi:UDP-N-acetylmuramoyl-L-alanine--D-glutamate ligase [Thermoflavimicrobium dichotomicum]|uniref:UDP-N-acetylmuramoylalanine--D-glutamate ligase n=1 Tax=Thermoflavimicrobium dichotomicum TaxID=46223 RepID=A0A1I3N690_9BACL|nr:UDP-N-acetylmuramoyl-L-alanine--D-glutamate ligase [Thermoflavimicrobium dichotomicum]SFJ04605.1 UDP-N-acetylmuramoylalanine--D-glutamate ligase [Thermoflavimicrobium dichotomicum]
MNRQQEDWSNYSIVVLGLARSGVAVAKLLHQLGAKVIANDVKPREKCPEAEELERLGIPVILGMHPEDLIHDGIDLIVKNPGIPYHVHPVQEALKRNIPVVTEVEIAGRLSKAPIIGITGSNGKTTTTTLVGKMLTAGGFKAKVAGNIGQALTEVVQDLSADEWLVAELSSFQLKGVQTFRPRIGALLNLVSAHLDYHQTMEDYIASKQRLFQNQSSTDLAVLNRDSQVCVEISQSISSTIWWFSRHQEVEQGVYVKDGWIVAKKSGEECRKILSVSEVALRGSFNLENALAATAIALACACPIGAIQETLRSFAGVEHRLEYVETIDGVKYYNNSKATNAQAAEKSLEAFTEPVVLIAGGLDRGVDFKELVPIFKEKVKAIITYGQTAPIFIERAKDAGITDRYKVADVKEAVIKASELAQSGDVVLLSPACASWDMYTSFEERGSIFKQAVHSLNNKKLV